MYCESTEIAQGRKFQRVSLISICNASLGSILRSPLAIRWGNLTSSVSLSPTMAKRVSTVAASPSSPIFKKAKREDSPPVSLSAASTSELADVKLASLQAKKLKALSAGSVSPFPTLERPTPEECQNIHDLLASVHGVPQRPSVIIDRVDKAGCGNSTETLEALVQTILSQNTTNKNSTAAMLSMHKTYGAGNYQAILDSTDEALEECIRSGGLAKNKSKAIRNILARLMKEQGALNMDYIREMDDADALKELCSFKGVGMKTASCVLLFNLGRDSFAVDT